MKQRGGKSTPFCDEVELSNDEDDDSLWSSSSLPSISDYSHVAFLISYELLYTSIMIMERDKLYNSKLMFVFGNIITLNKLTRFKLKKTYLE